MAKGGKRRAAVIRAAEAMGGALGRITGTIESLQAQHPHPVDEAREALAAGQETVAALASKAGTGAAEMVNKVKAVARRAQKATKRTRSKRLSMAAAKRPVKKALKRAKKEIKAGRKTAKRVAKRLKR